MPVPKVPLHCDVFAVELPVGLEQVVVYDIELQFGFQRVTGKECVGVRRVKVQHEGIGVDLERDSARQCELLNTTVHPKRELMGEKQLCNYRMSAHPN